MADEFRQHDRSPQELTRKFKDTGLVDPQGRPVYAEVLALEAGSIGGGGSAINTQLKGTTAAGFPTSTDIDANRTALDVYVRSVSGGGGDGAILDGVNAAIRATVTAGLALKVDGSAVTQPVSGTFWQVTQPVSGTFWQGTQPVSGTFWQATQPVSGTFFQATQPISAASLPLPTGAATSAAQTDRSQFTKITDGTRDGTVKAASTLAVATDTAVVVAIRDAAAVTGTFWQATQPVSLAAAVDVSDRAARLLGVVDKGKIWDGTNIATVKAGVIAVAGDNPLVVTVHPSSAPTTTQPISAASLPLPTGAATEATLASVSGKLPATLGQKAMSNSLAVTLASDQSTVPVSMAAASTLFNGRSSTFRTAGRAGTTGQKILSLHNATGSAVTVYVKFVAVDLVQTVIKAVTVLPPVIRLWKVTVLPTNGTALTKNKIGGSTTSNASVTVLGDASADGTGSGTTLTATLPAGTFVTQEFAPRLITAAGYEPADRVEFLASGAEIELKALEGLVLFVDYTLATQNPTTDMWIATIEWYEK